MEATLAECAVRAAHAQNEARALRVRAHAVLDAEGGAACEVECELEAERRALADAWRARVDDLSRKAIVAAETAEVCADAALERFDADKADKAEKKEGEEEKEGEGDEAQAQKSLHASARALRCLDQFLCNEKARALLLTPRTPADAFKSFFCAAAEAGDAPLVELLLLSLSASAAVATEVATECLLLAATRGHEDAVRVLLEDGRADPAAADARGSSACLRRACRAGRTPLVQMLLKDRRADPAARDGYSDSACLREACSLGHEAVVRKLLEDGRADPAAQSFEASSNEGPLCLFRAASNGHADTVALLLHDGRADPAIHLSVSLRVACRQGHTAVVRLLLLDGRADPAAQDSAALYHACSNGHADVVSLLLDDARVCPSPECLEIVCYLQIARR